MTLTRDGKASRSLNHHTVQLPVEHERETVQRARRARPCNREWALSWTSWSGSLGLGKYEAAFRENEIDETVLPNLTAEDLKQLDRFLADFGRDELHTEPPLVGSHSPTQ